MIRTSPLAAMLLLALAACTKAGAVPDREGAPIDAVRVAMPAGEAPSGGTAVEAKPQWVGSPDAMFARYGTPGGAPLLSLECRGGVVIVSRHVAAEVGAQALFALQGAGHIVRLPVDATPVPGARGYQWQGSIAPADPGAEVFAAAFNGTMPGGGMIKVEAGEPPRALLRRCGSLPATGAAPVAAPAE